MKKIGIYLVLLLSIAHAQKYDNHWVFGYQCWQSGLNCSQVAFTNDSLKLTHRSLALSMSRTIACVSNPEGELLFYTNGLGIANANNTILPNGSGLNPEGVASQWLYGSPSIQGAMFLPHPTDSNLYYLIHGGADVKNGNYYFIPNLYYTLLEHSANYPNGNVIAKNQVILSGQFEVGGITATKHGNGRDWWILLKSTDSTVFHRFLLNPIGVSYEGSQNTHVGNPISQWQTCFSPDGSKYAKYDCGKVQIYDFDRCTGLLSNFDSVNLACDGAAGIAFSPNSKLLYISTGEHLYQYDVSQNDLSNAGQLIAQYDSLVEVKM
ncbi:MAG: hypothetical protein ACKVTZ_12455 [Bacteroidia bacterium]